MIVESACCCGCHAQNNTPADCAWYSATTCGIVFECADCAQHDTAPAPPPVPTEPAPRNYPNHPYACTCALCDDR